MVFANGSCFFQQDNAPCHTKKKFRKGNIKNIVQGADLAFKFPRYWSNQTSDGCAR